MRSRLLLYMSSVSLGIGALVAIDSFSANVLASVADSSRALLGGDLALLCPAAPRGVRRATGRLARTHGSARGARHDVPVDGRRAPLRPDPARADTGGE